MTCPICKRPLPPADRPFAPFCSERCKLIDLGRWLGGRYQIPIAPDEAEDSPAAAEDSQRAAED